jgi:hypothetical protein
MVRNCQWVIKVEGERKKEKEKEREKNLKATYIGV